MQFYWRILAILSFMNQICLGYEATQFTCKTDRETVVLHVKEKSNEVTFFYYSTGTNLLLAETVSTAQLTYTIKLFRPKSAAPGEVSVDDHDRQIMVFTLPQNREVKRVQTGGYYIPQFTFYPVEFQMAIRFENSKDENNMSFNCTGH